MLYVCFFLRVPFVILGVRFLLNVFVRIVCDLSVMLYGVFCVFFVRRCARACQQNVCVCLSVSYCVSLCSV